MREKEKKRKERKENVKPRKENDISSPHDYSKL